MILLRAFDPGFGGGLAERGFQVIEGALRRYGFLVTNTDYDRINERIPRPSDYVDKCAENLVARGHTVEIETRLTEDVQDKRR